MSTQPNQIHNQFDLSFGSPNIDVTQIVDALKVLEKHKVPFVVVTDVECRQALDVLLPLPRYGLRIEQTLAWAMRPYLSKSDTNIQRPGYQEHYKKHDRTSSAISQGSGSTMTDPLTPPFGQALDTVFNPAFGIVTDREQPDLFYDTTAMSTGISDARTDNGTAISEAAMLEVQAAKRRIQHAVPPRNTECKLPIDGFEPRPLVLAAEPAVGCNKQPNSKHAYKNPTTASLEIQHYDFKEALDKPRRARHARRQSGMRCPLCEHVPFTSWQGLARHMVGEHDQPIKYLCKETYGRQSMQVCDYYTWRCEHIKRHLTSRHKSVHYEHKCTPGQCYEEEQQPGPRLFWSCHFCGNVAPNVDEWARHYKDHCDMKIASAQSTTILVRSLLDKNGLAAFWDLYGMDEKHWTISDNSRLYALIDSLEMGEYQGQRIQGKESLQHELVGALVSESEDARQPQAPGKRHCSQFPSSRTDNRSVAWAATDSPSPAMSDLSQASNLMGLGFQSDVAYSNALSPMAYSYAATPLHLDGAGCMPIDTPDFSDAWQSNP